MIIIRLQGGLGNQMFQYALYQSLKARGKEVKIDDVTGYTDDKKRVPMLAETYGLSYERATASEVAEILDQKRDPVNRLRRLFSGSRSKMRTETKEGNFEEDIPDADDVYLNGYWQTEKYFADAEVQRQLRIDFNQEPAKTFAAQEAWDLFNKIRNSESVGMHIRRGDYVEPGFVEVYGDICTEEYYRKAVDYILEKEPRAVFYIFSDDREWVSEHFNGDRFVIPESETPFSDREDMLLMRTCKHNIIANSSFSWWASWLSHYPDKHVVAPAKWLNTMNMTDIYTDRMVRL